MWNHQAILLLVASFQDKGVGLSNHPKNKKKLWNEVAAVMQEKGYKVTGDMCCAKMNTLKVRWIVSLSHFNFCSVTKSPWDDVLNLLNHTSFNFFIFTGHIKCVLHTH